MAIVREERIGGQRLILGDCLEVMPLLGEFDAVVTDPPYGLGDLLRKGGAKGWPNMAANRTGEWDNEAPDVSWISDLQIPAIIWGGNFFSLPQRRGWMIWDKKVSDFTTSVAELAWTNLDQPIKRHFLATCEALTPTGSDGSRVHPTQKPIALMEWCLGFLPDANTILDPFMGSGTTLVACERLSRNGVGIELDPDYFEIACKRVDEATRQPSFFNVEPKLEPKTINMSQVVLAVSEAQGYEMNAGTIRGALSNLKAWGLISAKPIPRPPAPRVTYRRETMDHKGNTE